MSVRRILVACAILSSMSCGRDRVTCGPGQCSCGFSPCGGDPIGEWTLLDDACMPRPDGNDTRAQECPRAIYTFEPPRARGTLSIRPDMTFSLVLEVGDAAETLQRPPSCGVGSCDASCQSSTLDGCVCRFISHGSDASGAISGRWTTAVGFFQPDHDASLGGYCVQGDTLRLRRITDGMIVIYSFRRN